jgi:hypothetical protein
MLPLSGECGQKDSMQLILLEGLSLYHLWSVRIRQTLLHVRNY